MEEEKVKVIYNGRISEAIKSGSSYLLYTSNGTISNSSEGWKLMCLDSEQPDYFFWLKYKKNGYMEWANDVMPRAQMSEGPYNPNYSNMGTLDGSARELYYVATQLEAHDKMGVSPAEVLELRYKMMGMALKMLGYDSPDQVLHGEPNPDISGIDLNRAVKFIEKIPAFAQYVTRGGYISSPTVEVNIPDDFDKEAFQEEYAKARQALNEEAEIYNSRMEFFNDIRHPMIKSDFCLGMKDNMPTSDWESYSGKVKELGKLILRLNADFLAPAEKMKIAQATSLDKEGVEYEISKITQDAEMDEALAAESYYFRDEVDSLDRKIEEDLKDDRTRNSTPGKTIKQFVRDLQVEVEDRKFGIERRDYMRNTYPYEKDPAKRQAALEKYFGIKKPESQDGSDKKGREPGE